LAAQGHRGEELKTRLRDDQTLTAPARRRALELARNGNHFGVLCVSTALFSLAQPLDFCIAPPVATSKEGRFTANPKLR
jgi:hypothetical protein